MKKIFALLTVFSFLTTYAFAGSTYDQEDTASLNDIETAVELLDNAISGSGYNITQLGGTAIATGSGVVGAGTIRSVLATDVALPAGTNAIGKLAANSGIDIGDVDVTSIAAGDNNIGNVDIVTFPDNEPFNVAQINGVAPSMGSGVVGTGVQRIVLATDVALPAGTNAIGKLSANSGVDIGDVDITSLPATPAGTNLIGRVSSSPETSTIYNGTTALTPKFAFANVAASQTDSNIVTAVASKKIRVVAVLVSSALTSTVIFNSKPAGAGTAISATITPATGTSTVLPYNPVGYFETTSGEGLTVTTGAGGASGIQVVYIEV